MRLPGAPPVNVFPYPKQNAKYLPNTDVFLLLLPRGLSKNGIPSIGRKFTFSIRHTLRVSTKAEYNRIVVARGSGQLCFYVPESQFPFSI